MRIGCNHSEKTAPSLICVIPVTAIVVRDVGTATTHQGDLDHRTAKEPHPTSEKLYPTQPTNNFIGKTNCTISGLKFTPYKCIEYKFYHIVTRKRFKERKQTFRMYP